MKKVFICLALFVIGFQVVDNLQAQELNINVSIRTAPPFIPVYEQPPCPIDGYLWIPGYWAWSTDDYYWVPGVWIAPPESGYLWTPGYWAFTGGYYGWNPGYWGLHVGYYGGINYGFGYIGTGFAGGRWEGGRFRYNTAVVNVNRTVIHNTYVDNTVINNVRVVNRVSYNGPGGVSTRPTSQQTTYVHERHVQATSSQINHQRSASMDHNQFVSVNSGTPHTVAMNKVNGERYNGNRYPSPSKGPDALAPADHNALKPTERASHHTSPAPKPVNQPQPQPDGQRNPVTPQPDADRRPHNQPPPANPAPAHPQPAQQPNMQPRSQPSQPRPASAPQNKPQQVQKAPTPHVHPEPHQSAPHQEHPGK